MVEVGARQLRFRRHLAACALVLLLNELAAVDLLGARLGGLLASGRRVAPASALDTLAGEANATRVYLYDTNEDSSFLARALAGVWDSLPVVNLNISLGPARRFEFGQLDADIDDYYNERFPAGMRLEELQLLSIKAAVRTAPIPLHTSWGYATRELLRQGSLPVRNDDLCAAQLAHLAQRLDRALREDNARPEPQDPPAEDSEWRQVHRTRDLELMRYLDTFGRVPADLLRGNVRWYGSRSSCLKMRLRPLGARPAAERPEPAIRFRYCLVAYKSEAWTQPGAGEPSARANASQWANFGVSSSDFNLGNLFLRLGACLPESCDSAAIERPENLRALERLLKFGLAKPFDGAHYKLADLYCQPDARSPLRSVPLAGKLLLGAAAGWLLLVLGATLVHLNVDKFYAETGELIDRQRRDSERSSDGEVEGRKSQRVDDEKTTGAGLAAAAAARGENEFKESGTWGSKFDWKRLGIGVRERARHTVEGVDLVECLSLYSNWLKYTQRLRMAIVRRHEREQEEAARRLERLHEARGGRDSPCAAATDAPKGPANGRLRDVDTPPVPGPLDARELGRVGATLDGRRNLNGPLPPPLGIATTRRTPSKRVNTAPLNALKVLALAWIIAGHCVFYMGSAIANGANLVDYLSTLAGYALSAGAIYITELFFIITGALTAYLIFKHTTRVGVSGERGCPLELTARAGSNKTPARTEDAAPPDCEMERHLFGPPFWLLVALNRYLRIVPAYLLVYAFVRLVSVPAGGQGQLWDYAVSPNSMRRACQQESWAPVLALTTNLVPIYGHCILGGWYLSADMQFSLMATPLLVLLARGQRVPAGNGRFVARATKRLAAAYALVLLAALLSGVASALASVLQSQVDMSYIIRFSPHTVAILSQNIAMYTNPVFRFRAFALGLALGHLLYLYEFGLIELPRLVRAHGPRLAVAIFACGFCLMLAPALYPTGKLLLSHDTTAALAVLTAAGLDLLLGALIFLACVGRAPRLALFLLNSPLWSLLSALSLCAFLVHTEVIVVLTSLLDPPPSAGYGLLLLVFSATLLVTYALALGLHLAFELPIGRLVAALMRALVPPGERERAHDAKAQQARW